MGSITLARQYTGNTTVYVVVGYYDTWEEQKKAIKDLVSFLLASGNNNVSTVTYTRPDDYKSTYVTIEK